MNSASASPARAAGRLSPVFRPKLLTTLSGYTAGAFLDDLLAGVIVGLVALPLAIAFGIASGVTPGQGLTTAIVAGFVISALGGSRVQIGGPTGAFVVIVYGIVEKHGVEGLTLCTLMAGVILILMGLFRLGTVIKFIPYPLTVGFTSGIAVVILSQQIKDLLGLTTGPVPADFVAKLRVLGAALPTLQPATALIAALSLAILIFWPLVSRRVPASIVAILVATPLVRFLHLPVDTIATRFGAIPSGLPAPALPHLEVSRLKDLVSPAFAVAMLGAIESLLSAQVADGMIEGRHRSNTELIAQGIANVVSPLFGGIPATGAIARTATNVRNGGRTPVAGMIHAVTLLLIILAFGRYAALIPLATLAAILVIVCYHMSEWRSFRTLLRAPRSDVAVLLSTFLLTVFVDLTVAVEAGMLFSLVLFVKRMTDVTSIREITQELARDRAAAEPVMREVPPGVQVYEAEGAFFFGFASQLRDVLELSANGPRAAVLRMDRVLALDATGARALADLKRTCDKAGVRLILCGLREQPRAALQRWGLLKDFGEGRLAAELDEALALARRQGL
jgi:SulP family sulfate permease